MGKMTDNVTNGVDESPDGLSHFQKNLIIFLLLVVIVLATTIVIAWFVWKRCCGADLKRARPQSESAFQEELETRRPFNFSRPVFEEPSHIRSDLDASSSRDPEFWHGNTHRYVEPSAPPLGSFTGPTAIPTSSLESISTGMGALSDVATSSTNSRLPSYETIMRYDR